MKLEDFLEHIVQDYPSFGLKATVTRLNPGLLELNMHYLLIIVVNSEYCRFTRLIPIDVKLEFVALPTICYTRPNGLIHCI